MQVIQSEFKVDVGAALPLYLQLIEHIQSHVASGRFEPGQQLPTVRSLAAQLGINPGTVAKAYGELERAGVIVAHRGGGTCIAPRPDSARLSSLREARLSAIVGKSALEALSLGYSPQEIEAAFVLQLARWRQERETRETGGVMAVAPPTGGSILLKGSHDLTLDLLAAHVRRLYPESSLDIANIGSLGGLVALERGEAHVAGAHLLDEETGQYNIPFVKRLFPGQEVYLVTLAHRFQGLILASGNPKGIEGLEGLRGEGVRFINRQRGSGTRVLLDHKLRCFGITSEEIAGYEREVDTHLAVAAAVSTGNADAGIGIYAAAKTLGLFFIPLLEERFDLVIPKGHYESRLLKPLLDAVSTAEFKEVVDELGGYNTAETGKVTIVR